MKVKNSVKKGIFVLPSDVRSEVYMYIYMGNFRSTEQGENFKFSETWLSLFKIMKKNTETNFSAIYANVQKLF